MSDTPKFEVIDRRKMKAEEEQTNQQTGEAAPPAQAEKPKPPVEQAGQQTGQQTGQPAGPRLVDNKAREERREAETGDAKQTAVQDEMEMPAPTAEESREQKAAYDASSQRLEDLIRAQNPAAGPLPPVTFEQLVQQFYVSAMIQMGAGATEGQRPRVDIVGARNTIDLLGVLAEKTKGNLTEAESRTLDTVLFEARMAFLELTNMISMQAMQPPGPPPGKK